MEFNIATDRRDKLQRATNIELVHDTFKVNGEKREPVSLHKSVIFFESYVEAMNLPYKLFAADTQIQRSCQLNCDLCLFILNHRTSTGVVNDQVKCASGEKSDI